LKTHASLLLCAAIQLKLGLFGHERIEGFKLVCESVDLAPEGEFVFTEVQLTLVGFLEV